jgi:hypothetical protein
MKYIGIDLHATNSVIAIVDAQEQVLYCKRHANRLQHILALLRPYRDSGCVAAVESTYNWYWLIDLSMPMTKPTRSGSRGCSLVDSCRKAISILRANGACATFCGGGWCWSARARSSSSLSMDYWRAISEPA